MAEGGMFGGLGFKPLGWDEGQGMFAPPNTAPITPVKPPMSFLNAGGGSVGGGGDNAPAGSLDGGGAPLIGGSTAGVRSFVAGIGGLIPGNGASTSAGGFAQSWFARILVGVMGLGLVYSGVKLFQGGR